MRICVLGSGAGEREGLAGLAALAADQVRAGSSLGDCGCASTGEPCDIALIDAGDETAAFGLCREIAAERVGNRPYIVMVNLPPGPECAARALAAGADDVLALPLDGERLATRLEVARWRVGQDGEASRAGTSAEATYRALFEQKLDAVFVLDAAGRYIDANEAACAMSGYSRRELLSMSAHDVVDPDDLATNPFRLEYLASGGALTLVERRIRRKDGSIVVCETSISGMPGGQILAITRDIGDRKRHEAALRASEERFRTFYEKTPIMLHSIDSSGRVVAASDHILEVLGYEREEVLGRLSTDFLTPESAELARTVTIPQLLRTGAYLDAAYQMVKRNGEIIDIVTSSFMLIDEHGRNDMSLSVSVDVTEQRRVERALRESEERLRLILDVCPDLVGWIDRGGRLVFANAAHSAALGVDPADLAGQNMLDLVHPEDITDVVEGIQRLAAGEPTRRDGAVVRFRRADGSWAPLEMRARALRDRDGETIGIIVVSRDVSERLAQEEALRSASAFRELVMESATNAIYALDLEGRFTFVNRRATEITGYPEEELLGQSFAILLEPAPLVRVTEQFARAAVHGQRVTEFEVDLRQKAGSYVTITFSLAPLEKDGTITGVVGTAEDITARRRALEMLHQSEERYRRLVEMSPNAIVVHREGRLLYANAETLRLLGTSSPAEVVGRNLTDFIDAEHLERARAAASDQEHPGAAMFVEVLVKRLDGTPLHVELSSAPAMFEGRLATQTVVRDVSERKRAEEAVRQSEDRYRRLVEASPVATVVHEGGIVCYASQAARALFGVPQGMDIVGLSVTSFIALGELDSLAEEARLLAGGATYLPPAERHLLRLDGEAFEGELTVVPTRFEGRPAVQVVVRDLTHQRRAEEAVRQASEQFRRLVETSPVATVVHEDGVIRFANRAALEMFRATDHATILGSNILELVAPADREAAAARLETMRQGASSLPPAVRKLVRFDGSEFEAEITVAATTLEGRPASQVAARDLTEQRRAEEVVRRTSEQYRRLVQMSPVAMAVVRDSCVAYANDECVRVFGAPSLAEAIGKPIYEFVSGERRQEVELWVAAFLEDGGQIGPFETRARRWNGQSFDAEASATAITYDGAQAALLVVRDLSEQKRAEEERLAFERNLLESQKLESLGVLAGGVAHDFNNLLVAIMGNVSLSLMEAGEASPLRPYLEEIETASQRAADLARQMLAYSGKGRLAVSRVQVNELVNEMGKLVSVSIPRSVMLEWQLAGSLPPVEADATQLRQVVMNLVINAAEAIGERDGVIRISTGVMQASQRYLQNTIMPFKGITEGEYVFFEVADTGAGMDPETVERMFDPFFTTKFTGRGLGMAAVLGIVRGHRGAIRVESAKGKGTTIRVLLPPAGAGSPAEEQPSAPSARATSRGHVLVIDDEPGIRAVASRMLERMGFAVTAVADGAAGVESFAENHQGLAAVLLDMTMPRMGGAEAFARFREIAPGVPVVAMSGFSEEEALSTFQGDGPRAFLQKPFSMGDLEAALGRTLAPGG